MRQDNKSQRNISNVGFKFPLQFQHLSSIEQSSQIQLYLSHLKSLIFDAFPYLSIASTTFVFIVFEILIFLVVDQAHTVIKPYKGFNDILPWILSVLAPTQKMSDDDSNLTTVVCHVLFLMSVGAELEYKLKNTNKFMTVYVTPVMISNLFLHIFWAPYLPLCCNNISTYSIYCSLLLHRYTHKSTGSRETSTGTAGYADYDYTYRSSIEAMEVDKPDQSDKDLKVVTVYKIILLSYLVLQASSKQECLFCAYVVAIVVQIGFLYFGLL